MLSHWERDALVAADAIVVGGGLIGLSTALELRRRRPSARVLVLERGLLPSGATSRNAGFACFGNLTEILSDIEQMGESAAVGVVARRWQGLGMLRARFPDPLIAYQATGGSELLFAADLPALDEIGRVNALLRPIVGADTFHVEAGARARFGPRVAAVVVNPFEGLLHSGLLCRSLVAAAGATGVEILTGAEVTGIDEAPGHAEVVVRGVGGTVTLEAAQVVLCTNGALCDLAPGLGVVPVRGQVLVTAPVPGLPWRGAHHLDRGFFYFRDLGGDRVLLGGGRNLDLSGEATARTDTTEAIQAALEALLREVLLPGRAVAVERRWAGTMGMSGDKQPIVRRLSGRVVVGFGCNGMGVALGSEVAARAAALAWP